VTGPTADLRDPAAFGAAYARHAPRAIAAAQRILGDRARAEDAAHDAFLRLWRDPGAYDPQRAELGAYVAMLARSRALDVWRSDQAAARACQRLAALGGEARSPAPDPAEAALGVDRRALARALGRLPEAQREAVLLAYWGGLTIAEIARRTRVPLGTAKGRLRLALEKLATGVPGAPASA
jgi:RNA polymerase sigma-70 factor, ECF subfamily